MNADLKISLHVRVYIKIVLWKICILNPYSPVPNNSPPFLFGLLLLVPHSPLSWIGVPLAPPSFRCPSPHLSSTVFPLPLRLPSPCASLLLLPPLAPPIVWGWRLLSLGYLMVWLAGCSFAVREGWGVLGGRG